MLMVMILESKSLITACYPERYSYTRNKKNYEKIQTGRDSSETSCKKRYDTIFVNCLLFFKINQRRSRNLNLKIDYYYTKQKKTQYYYNRKMPIKQIYCAKMGLQLYRNVKFL